MARSILLIACLAALSACSGEERGTSVTINADGGNVAGAVDGGTGELNIDVPGFEGSLKLPKFKVDAGNLDLNGARLFPGTTIDGIDIAGAEGSQGQGVRVSFTSPASADEVRRWLNAQFAQAGFKLDTTSGGLTGTTEDGKPFRIDLRPDGGSSAKGVITIG